MLRVLIAWVGTSDLYGPSKAAAGDVGPIAQALDVRTFDRVVLLESFSKPEHQNMLQPYVTWLRGRTKAEVVERPETLAGPTDFGGIYEAARRACQDVLAREKDAALTFHLSPGSPPMAAVWMLLGKTIFRAELIESSREQGVRTANVPFDIAAEFLPDLLRAPDERLRSQSTADSPPAPEFKDIIHRSQVMARLIQRARRVALRNVPVLIEGESGTGKELLAKAIHRASPRRGKPFIPVNCGAIPESLVEAELFGVLKGVGTGVDARKGFFESADGGTLFLDELGELPLPVQVKLLRVLQEREVTPLGAREPKPIDVRVIAATNRTVVEEVEAGRFREDLFYRLAVAVLKLPPLRDRPGDTGLLVDELLKVVNQEAATEPGYVPKKFSTGARNLILAHPWPGNVRELLLTVKRAAIWSDGATISAEDVRESLLAVPHAQRRDVLGRPLGGGLNLQKILKEVAQHYLGRALNEAAGNKTRAAKLVGAPSYQTLSNWLRKYGVGA
ncbi:sigma-54 interaction domain-containing protein [Corallococcus aberystwythensis]|uniref:Sigma-54-dependent Fis family transcriptional regulator n=1 Tax=Corallococcus aberystwythensis TaxID=2316722 RepID=A0A3A8QKU6_9BACT|nr:sigma-54 dependent transcriptional regulator [Corallococcus aberystwythensis]RKH69396.1 sigma-54-dependent Fis family transcriptional regulator [Corallococcus aberystwythensis]